LPTEKDGKKKKKNVAKDMRQEVKEKVNFAKEDLQEEEEDDVQMSVSIPKHTPIMPPEPAKNILRASSPSLPQYDMDDIVYNQDDEDDEDVDMAFEPAKPIHIVASVAMPPPAPTPVSAPGKLSFCRL
jgi:hypothetical protein